MAAGPVENVDVYDLGDPTAPTDQPEGSAATGRGMSPDGRPPMLLWTGALLLLVAVLLSLLTLTGTAYTATSRTPSQTNSNCHEDLAGDTSCDSIPVQSQVYIRRVDAWGRTVVTGQGTQTDGSAYGTTLVTEASGQGPQLGLGYLIGAIGIAVALVCIGAATRWPRRRALAARATLAAVSVLLGITIAQFIFLIGTRSELTYQDPSTAPELSIHTSFSPGNSAVLGLVATAVAVAGAVALLVASRSDADHVTVDQESLDTLP